jgi:hypothetical protein
MRRAILITALAVSFAGCHKEVTRENPQADTHVDIKPGLFEVDDCAHKFKDKLAAFRFPDDAVTKFGTPMPVALLRFKNETADHFDTALFTDSIRDTLMETGKVAFQIEKERVGEAAEQQNYEQNFNNTDPNQQAAQGTAAGTRYLLYGRIAEIAKRDASEGLAENTYVVTIEMLDKQRNLSILISREKYRLRRQ